MSFEKLKLHSHELIQYMRDNEYSESYIQLLQSEINWIQKNSDSFDSYESACLYRENGTASYDMKRRYRLFYGIMKRFDVDGVLPDYRRKEPLFKRGAYHKLCAVFQKIIDYYCEDAGLRNLKLQTINGNASGGSNFLLAMQEKGHFSLDEISEDDAMSFFTDSSGMVVLSDSYRKEVSAVLSADLGEYTQAAGQVHTYLPRTRNRRKNIAYLQPEETACIHNTIEDNSAGKLSLRDRAVASLVQTAELEQELKRTGVPLQDVLERYSLTSAAQMSEEIFKSAMRALRRTSSKKQKTSQRENKKAA